MNFRKLIRENQIQNQFKKYRKENMRTNDENNRSPPDSKNKKKMNRMLNISSYNDEIIHQIWAESVDD